MKITILFGLFLCIWTVSSYPDDEFYYGTFPDGFIFSTATAAYQIEGGWNEGGKGENIWDTFTHKDPSPIENGDTGDVACDSYHLFKEDVKLLVDVGVKAYRFSIAWARILPDGDHNNINMEGVDYYNALINELLSNNIIPMVTLYHWDLPQSLENIGGWENSELVDYFANYARVLFSLFGDRVKFWITLNEPWCQSVLGHGTGVNAPGKTGIGSTVYKVSHNLIKAHAAAWHAYNNEFRPTQNGKCGITLNSDFNYPKNELDPADVAASERAIQFFLGWFAHPIYHADGDYPPIMRELIDRKSQEQGLAESRLPTFTKDEINYIKGSSDFFGLNTYTTHLVENHPNHGNPNYFDDADAASSFDPDWEASGSSWLKMVPWGIRGLLNWIKNEYGDHWDIYITENGWSDRHGDIEDDRRVYHYRHYINNVLKAVNLDKVNVKAYTAWSVMDNFEWAKGYVEKFGMHAVNMSDPNRKRTPKASSRAYAQIIKDHGFPQPTEA